MGNESDDELSDDELIEVVRQAIARGREYFFAVSVDGNSASVVGTRDGKHIGIATFPIESIDADELLRELHNIELREI